jgi:hypothetical protein
MNFFMGIRKLYHFSTKSGEQAIPITCLNNSGVSAPTTNPIHHPSQATESQADHQSNSTSAILRKSAGDDMSLRVTSLGVRKNQIFNFRCFSGRLKAINPGIHTSMRIGVMKKNHRTKIFPCRKFC